MAVLGETLYFPYGFRSIFKGKLSFFRKGTLFVGDILRCELIHTGCPWRVQVEQQDPEPKHVKSLVVTVPGRGGASQGITRVNMYTNCIFRKKNNKQRTSLHVTSREIKNVCIFGSLGVSGKTGFKERIRRTCQWRFIQQGPVGG